MSTAAITDRHSAWLLGRRLLAEAELAQYRSYALPELISLAYPGAPEAEEDLLTDILGWFTVLDDHFDGPIGRDLQRARQLVGRLMDVLHPSVEQGPPAGRAVEWAGAVHGAWAELWERQCRGRSAAWRRRAAQGWADCLNSFVAETEYRTRGRLPSLAEATLLRRHASCLYPFMDMLERAHGGELSARLCRRTEWHRLRANTADAATLINDLFSLEREEAQREGAGFNMVILLRRSEGLGAQESRRVVAGRVRRLIAHSEVLRARLAAAHPDSCWYLTGTRQLVDAVEAWTSSTSRYRPL